MTLFCVEVWSRKVTHFITGAALAIAFVCHPREAYRNFFLNSFRRLKRLENQVMIYKLNPIALMGTASFAFFLFRKRQRYSGQQEIAPNNNHRKTPDFLLNFPH